jgi:ABC-type glycerol-3-phosphate transport system substrate-binding protein
MHTFTRRAIVAGVAVLATLGASACAPVETSVTCWDASDAQHYCADHSDGTVTHNDRLPN